MKVGQAMLALLAGGLTVGPAMAGVIVTDPANYQTAKVDPLNHVEGTVGPTFGVAGWNAQSQIYTLDFESANGFVVGSAIDQVKLTALNQTVTFSGPAGNGFAVTNDRPVGYNYNWYTSGSQGLSTIAATDSRFTITFSTAVTGVAINLGYSEGGMRVHYYDASHTELYAPSQNSSGGNLGAWKDYFFTYSGTPISSIEFERLYVTNPFTIDDLSFTQQPVPEAASIGLLGTFSLALLRRRASR